MIFFLIGMPGSGKSRKGRELAELFNYEFIDLDQTIEKNYGKSVSSIIQDKGLEEFRNIERDHLYELIVAKKDSMILALGGGTVTISGLVEKISRHGKIVYLDANINLLVSRLIGGLKRPLFLDENKAPMSENELRTEILKLYFARKEQYEKADIKIELPCKSETIHQRLLELL